jgi:hypothetical protein
MLTPDGLVGAFDPARCADAASASGVVDTKPAAVYLAVNNVYWRCGWGLGFWGPQIRFIHSLGVLA